MNQPQLGLKVSELRQQKNLTQEQLAERCEVSTRTIQRIEAGEVDPRAFTLQCLSNALGFDFDLQNSSNETPWLLALHLSSIFCIVIIPLLLWSWKKNQSYKIDRDGRQVLNFQITMTLSLFASVIIVILVPAAILLMGNAGITVQEGIFVLLALCVPLPLIAIGIFCTFQGVANAIRAMSDKPINYPLSIPFIK